MSALSRLARLERRRRAVEPEIWVGWPGCWVGPDGEQRAEPPAGRVIVLSWGEPESGQLAGGQG